MTPERWQQIKQLFDAAMERKPTERAAFLGEACGGDDALRREVESLAAAHDDAGSRYETPVVAADPMLSRLFGPYRIVRRLGAGGMGTVYLASRADDQFRRLVAIKAIRPELLDDHTRRRFENERQTLAALEHPNIVRLLDGGTTGDGIPYLVMDYVEGQAINRYARDRNLSIAERLALFRTLCGAVHYAHQNLVVHRDLKPANILVTPQGVPKLLDFGIAKLLSAAYAASTVGITRTVAQPMTPEYASPEQIQGQPVTTSSDIYSLGVLLYSLLAGKHPFEAQSRTTYEVERAICEGPLLKPSDAAPPELARQLHGDLDAIVQTAMRKEPQHRYASAEHMAEDVRRYLEGQPVTARGESRWYRARKFARRHSAALGATLTAVALLAGLAVKDDLDGRRAGRRFEELRGLANYVINDLDHAMAEGITPAREAVTTRALAYLDALAREAKSDDALQREAMTGYLKVAAIQGDLFAANVGKASDARETALKALAIGENRVRSHPQDPNAKADLALCHAALGDILATGADRTEALEHYRIALDEGHAAVGQTLHILGRMAYIQGELYDPAAARDTFLRYQQVAEEWLRREPRNEAARERVAFGRERIAWFAVLAGDSAGAEDAIRDAIATYQQLPNAHTAAARRNIALAYKALADVQARLKKYSESLKTCETSLAASEALRAEDPGDDQNVIDIAQDTVLLVKVLIDSGQRAEAERRARPVLDSLRANALGPAPEHYHLADYVQLLVLTFPRFATAEETVARAKAAASLMHEEDPETLDLLAKAYEQAGRREDAVAAEREAIRRLPPLQPGRPVDARRREFDETLSRLERQIVTESRRRP